MNPDSAHHSSRSSSRRRWFWRISSLVIAAGIVVFMLQLVDWSALWQRMQQLPPWSLVAALGLYSLLNIFRALRYRALLSRDASFIPLLELIPIGFWHNFLVRLLPFKLGELTYITLLKRRLRLPVEAGVSSLFGSRLLELLIIVLVAAVSLLASGDIVPNQNGIALLLIGISITGGILSLYYSGTIIRGIVRYMRHLISLPVIVTLCDKLDALATEFDHLRRPLPFAQALMWSCFTYGCSFGVNAILLYAIGIDLSLVELVLLVSLGMFATAFPFNISGFGTVELSWAFGLSALAGYSIPEATSIGLLLNGYQLICAAVTGILGWLALQRRPHGESD